MVFTIGFTTFSAFYTSQIAFEALPLIACFLQIGAVVSLHSLLICSR